MPIGRRRRPLMRAAMVGGGAYVAGKHAAAGQQREADQNAQIADLQESQYAEQPQQQYAPPPPPAPAAYAPPAPAPAPAAAAPALDPIEALTQAKQLLDAGVLTQEEFDAQKARILGG